jgi:hypothetical protein
MSNTQTIYPKGLLFLSCLLTLAILFGTFAVLEHNRDFWFMLIPISIMIIGWAQQARRAPRKEIETLDL